MAESKLGAISKSNTESDELVAYKPLQARDQIIVVKEDDAGPGVMNMFTKIAETQGTSP